jgi:hypothetical protein
MFLLTGLFIFMGLAMVVAYFVFTDKTSEIFGGDDE